MAAKHQLHSFDSIQFCMPDIHTVPRGKVVTGDAKEKLAREGLLLWNGLAVMGPLCELTFTIPQIPASYGNHELRPCLETLTPWPWVGSENRRVGNILCDMYRLDGSPDLNCPRQLLTSQVNALWENQGLTIKTAFEYEFFAFKENTLEPLGSGQPQFCDLRVWDQHQELLSDLRETLKVMDIQLQTTQAEYAPGQWELGTEPYQGVRGADVGFYVKNAVKGFFQSRGYDATFMTRPTLENMGSGLHLNHSLWRPGSIKDGTNEENVFRGNNGDGLSQTAKHWIAGLLTHASALTALQCPTLNCYRRLHSPLAPNFATWGFDDRNALVRVTTFRNNVFLENRLPSAAASPYLALAATVAAGRDGLERRLECPQPMDTSTAVRLPSTLNQALTALEEDRQLGSLLGQDFVDCYVQSKRELEVIPFEKAELVTDAERFTREKHMYFKTY